MTITDQLSAVEKSLAFCQEDIQKAVKILNDAWMNQGIIWVIGNGGSLAIAQHFAQDILKCHGIRAVCLNDPSIITAYANDTGFERCFTGPLTKLSFKDDVILIFSCSGNSRNYIGIGKIARCVAVVGTNGGFLKEDADAAIHVRSEDYAVCETAFSLIADVLNDELGKLKNAKD